MAGKLTTEHSVNVAKKIKEDLSSTNNTYYVFAARNLPWDDEENAPSANISGNEVDLTVHNHLLFGKLVTDNDVKYMIPRYNWTSNTVYTAYDKDDADLQTKNFYVVTSQRHVYKVIDNNSNSYSTVQPTLTTTNLIKTGDGYIWKYMFTIDPTSMTNFATRNFIPVVSNTVVESAASPGRIDTIKIISGGTGWSAYNTGFIQAVPSSTSVVLDSTASTTDNFYVDSSIYFKNGLASGQIKKIIGYEGDTKTVTLENDIDYKINLELNDIVGNFLIGDTVSQHAVILSTNNVTGNFDVGDTITQSTTGATGTVIRSQNFGKRLQLNITSGTFSNSLVIDSGDSLLLGNGTVTANLTSNTITGNNTVFTTLFPSASLPHYIKIGNYTRKIVSVANNTSLTVMGTSSGGFDSSYTANVYYKVPSAAMVVGVEEIPATGTIEFSDLNSTSLNIKNRNRTFALGETVVQPASSSNGTIVFSNNSFIILSDISGPGFTNTDPILGLTTAATANIQSVIARPSITVNNIDGSFILGGLISGDIGGQAKIKNKSTLPNEDTEYVITPTITISGDGTNASAYATVNTSTSSISSVIMIDNGQNYTEANVYVYANSSFNASANLIASIGPIEGHGRNPAVELGGRYLMVSVNLGTSNSESYDFPSYGSFRKVGLMKSPLFNDVTLSLPTSNGSFKRAELILNNASSNFEIGETVYQANTKSTGKIVYYTVANSVVTMEIEDIRGSFSANTIGDNVIGLSTDTTANVRTSNLKTFTKNPGIQIIRQEETGATGFLSVVTANTINLSNVNGIFQLGKVVYDSTTNSYANTNLITLANGTKATTFQRFSQLGRITLSSIQGQFSNNEKISFITASNSSIAQAVVYSNVDDVDLGVSSSSGTFTLNERVIQNTSNASGIVRQSNSSHIKLTSVSGTFSNQSGYFITGQTSSANAHISNVYKVLVVSDVDGTWSNSNTNIIIGNTSGATGYSSLSNTIIYPELVKNSGEVLYIENREFIERSPTTSETIRLLIKF